MGKIVNLPNKEENDPHGTGTIICFGCKYEWIGVIPIGTIRVECPNCHAHKGVLKFEYMAEEIWECECGNDLFHIAKDGFFCANCGVYQKF